MNRKELWQTAIGRVLREDPFLGTVVLRHKLKWNDSIPSALIDGETIQLNEKWWRDSTPSLACFRLRHLAAHVAFGHHLRRGNRDQETWNLATDLAINPLLQLGQQDKIGDMPDAFDLPSGKTAEWYYAELQQQDKQEDQDEDSDTKPEDEEQEQDSPGQDDSGKDESDDDDEDADDADNQSESDDSDDADDGEQDGDGSPAEADEGDGDESDSPGRNVKPDPSDLGSPADCPIPNGSGELAITLVQAGQAAAGSMQGWEEIMLAKMMNPPPLNPKTLLRLYMQQAAQTKQTYSRTNRRTAWRTDVIMPGRFERTLGKVSICIDTSGSVTEIELAWAMCAINEIIGAFPETEVTVIEADTVVHRVASYKGIPLPVNTKFKGRGGTLFAEALLVAEKSSPTVILYITDGYPARWPDMRACRTPVVWLMTRNGATAPWGRQVNIPVG